MCVLNFADCVKNMQNPKRFSRDIYKLYLAGELSVPMPPTRKMSVIAAFEMRKSNDIMDSMRVLSSEFRIRGQTANGAIISKIAQLAKPCHYNLANRIIIQEYRVEYVE